MPVLSEPSKRFLWSAAMVVAAFCSVASAQGPPVHYFHSADLPAGTIGHGQLLRFPHMQGYFQPVQLLLPEGARVSLSIAGSFQEPLPGPVLAGMQVGQVYPLKITSIPFFEGFEVYPTVELVNRIYPPKGRELHFPVPIQITREDLELALSGQFVVRVIYLEDPHTALAYRDEPQQQRYFDAGPDQDPLRIADRLGRPMAILRMGSRIPAAGSGGVASHHPPVMLYESPGPRDPDTVRSAVDREARHYPRTRSRTTSPPSRIFSVGVPQQP